MMRIRWRRVVVGLLALVALLVAQRAVPPFVPSLAGCSLRRLNRYELSSDVARATFKHVRSPFSAGTSFRVAQGPFGVVALGARLGVPVGSRRPVRD